MRGKGYDPKVHSEEGEITESSNIWSVVSEPLSHTHSYTKVGLIMHAHM